MSDYSEKQLLMLTQFVYLDCSVSDKTISSILDEYRNEAGDFTTTSVMAAGSGGGMNADDVVKLFKAMDEEIDQDASFGQLSASRKLNEDKIIRAICYTDTKDDNPVIAIRGTGGTKEAWTDNIMGGYETDTRLQALTADFVEKECSTYSNITIAGHSKGGNLSQYVTVMCPDMIKRCVSFDGQGFNEEFISDNKSLIDVAAPKIKSISAYNDFVNILLTSIAGEVIYVANNDSVIDAHSGLSLLLCNTYDENGNFISIKEQGAVSRSLKTLSDNLVDLINPMDTKDKKVISNVAGATIATALNEDIPFKIAAVGGCLATNVICNFIDNFLKNKHDDIYGKKPQIKYVYYDRGGIYKGMSLMEENKVQLLEIKSRVQDIKSNMSKSIATRIYAERKLDNIIDSLEKTVRDIDRLSTTLDMILLRYENKDKTLAGLFGP